LAVVFVVALFFIKNQTLIRNNAGKAMPSVYYEDELVVDLINQDTDLDGIPDWEESLWATNPAKKDTNNDGISDNEEISQTKNASGDEEHLTQTDKFSRELFSAVATLNQNGLVDETTVDNLSDSLADQIQNRAPRRVFQLSELKVIKDRGTESAEEYNDAQKAIFRKHVPSVSLENVLTEAIRDSGNIDMEALSKLDLIINQINGVVRELLALKVPESLAQSHLEVINEFEKLSENLSDMKLIEVDPIVAFGAMNRYEENILRLQESLEKLTQKIKTKS